MLLIATEVWVESMNAILETVVEIGIDVAVVSCRNCEALIDDFRDRPSFALIRAALFCCSIVLHAWMTLVAPTGRQAYGGIIASGLVATKIQTDEAWGVWTVSWRPEDHVDSQRFAVPLECYGKLSATDVRLRFASEDSVCIVEAF
jgi:hypothetical protein